MMGKIFWLLAGAGFAALVSGFATPVIWLVLRLAGLIDLLLPLFSDIFWLVWLGGLLFGLPVGMLFMALIGRTFGRVDKWGLLFGALGGAAGGVVSSLMFFPLVAIL